MYVKEKNTFSVKRTAGLTDDRSRIKNNKYDKL